MLLDPPSTATTFGTEIHDDELAFECSDGSVYRMRHSQDCCEIVELIDVEGEWFHLIGEPLVLADESSNESHTSVEHKSCTWTFYRLATIKGHITMRWYGTSNGCYSERAELYLVKLPTLARQTPHGFTFS